VSDGEPNVIPIRPELAITDDRARAILDHFVEELVTFARDNDGELPRDVAFVIIGEKGTGRPNYLIEERSSANLAWAALLLENLALNRPE
jgi:hypothetical protein